MSNMQGIAGQNYIARSGNAYQGNPVGGVILNVAQGDVIDLINAGCSVIAASKTQIVDLFTFKNSDGSAIAAAAAAGKFGYTVTGGTAFNLIGEVATSNTKTDVAIVNVKLPQEYVAGNNITVGINCALLGGASTLKTMGLNAYPLDQAGNEGADLCATAAQAMGTTPGILNFTVTGATLVPGQELQLKLTSTVTEAAAGAIHTVVDGVTIT